MDNVVLHPPPTALDKCPRCEKAHKKLKSKKLQRPMFFFGPDPKPTDKPIRMASYWTQCPKLKEPIIFYDRYDRFQTTANIIASASVWTIANAEDKKLLGDIKKLTKRKPAVIRMRFKGGKTQKWVHE